MDDLRDELGLAQGGGRMPRLFLDQSQALEQLVPQSLAPLLQRRVAFKEQLNRMQAGDPRKSLLKKYDIVIMDVPYHIGNGNE